ncbi:hypothetical protein [Castellaniella sp.]|uniref:hypothetical protein n=1 Tax=Castellaniella sp. TaxID=1955812 RepID=UPI003A959D01
MIGFDLIFDCDAQSVRIFSTVCEVMEDLVSAFGQEQPSGKFGEATAANRMTPDTPEIPLNPHYQIAAFSY